MHSNNNSINVKLFGARIKLMIDQIKITAGCRQAELTDGFLMNVQRVQLVQNQA